MLSQVNVVLGLHLGFSWLLIVYSVTGGHTWNISMRFSGPEKRIRAPGSDVRMLSTSTGLPGAVPDVLSGAPNAHLGLFHVFTQTLYLASTLSFLIRSPGLLMASKYYSDLCGKLTDGHAFSRCVFQTSNNASRPLQAPGSDVRMRVINKHGAAWNYPRCVSGSPKRASLSVSCIVSQINAVLGLHSLLFDSTS